MGLRGPSRVELCTESGSYPQISPQLTTSLTLYTTTHQRQTTLLSQRLIVENPYFTRIS